MTGIIIAIIVAIIVLFIILTYNKLIKARNNVKNSFAQIDTQLQRRFDLIPNLVETVKGISNHEKEIVEKIAESRKGYMSANTSGEKLEMNNQLSLGLRSLFAIVENYPEIKASDSFKKLQDELSKTEDKVTYSRQFYNDAVTIYNNKLQSFPNNLIGAIFGFKEEVLFNVSEEVKEAPKVKF